MSKSLKHLTWRHGIAFIAVAAAVIILDQTSKEWIRSNIAVGDSSSEIGHLIIVHVQNSGSAFGLFTDQTFLLSMVAIVGLVIVLIFFRYLAELGFAAGIALSLIFGGALGNLIDRLRFGYVTDFIYVRLWDNVFWPAFNVADSAITIGALSLAAIVLFKFRKEDESKSRSGDKSVRGS